MSLSLHPTHVESGPPQATGGVAKMAYALAPCVLLAGFAGGLAFPILPIVGARQGLPLAWIGVILAANRATRVLTAPFVGSLVDRIGGRRTLILGLVAQIFVMLAYRLGVEPGWAGTLFLAGRILHGPASGCVFVSGQALALQAGGRHSAGASGALVRAAIAVGVPVGIVAGGFLSEAIGDARTFELAAVAVLLGVLAAFRWVPDLRTHAAPRWKIGEAMRSMLQGPLAAIGALNFTSNFSAQGMVLSTLLLLVAERRLQILHFGPQATASSLMGLMLIVESAAMPFMGRAGDRLGAHARIATMGLLSLSGGLVVVGLSPDRLVLAAGLALIGLGTGALGPSLLALVPRWVPAANRGIGVGALQLCGDAGGALGPLVGTTLLAGSLRTPYLVAAALAAFLLPVGVWLGGAERRKRG